METPPPESELEKRQGINKKLFLLQTKWIDIFKLLAEINQITMELLLEERDKE